MCETENGEADAERERETQIQGTVGEKREMKRYK